MSIVPFLFSLFLNDLEKEFSDHVGTGVGIGMASLYLLLFADDLILFAPTAIYMQRMINLLEKYCDKWKLKINTSKTKIMVFRKGGYLRHYENWTLYGKNVPVTSQYNYLGVIFTPKCVFTQAQRCLAGKASKALFILKKHMSRFCDIPVKVWLKLFDAKILPILLYGSEVWGFHEGNDIEIVHNKFCKYLLSLGHSVSNAAVRGELGRHTVRVHRLSRIILYWIKIIKSSNNHYLKLCYNQQFEMTENGRNCWALDVKNLLFAYGFGFVWLNQGVENENVFISEFKLRCRDIDTQTWHDRVRSQSLDVYNMVKTNCMIEKYVMYFHNSLFRHVIAKYRCAGHSLNIVKGRHTGVPKEDRLCQVCSMRVCENEVHFILECPVYARERRLYLPSDLVVEAVYLCNLLSTEDIHILRGVAKFIIQAETVRKQMLGL